MTLLLLQLLSHQFTTYCSIKKDSQTTPVRIVYDCSCRENPSAASLDDYLEAGPPLLNNLYSILLRFHLHIYALSTDIEKAFLHVRLHEDDRNFTRFCGQCNLRTLTVPFRLFVLHLYLWYCKFSLYVICHH